MNRIMSEEVDVSSLDPEEFFKSLSKSDRILISLRDELYDGCWDTMIEDITNRMKGQPYLFDFVNRAEKDIQSIKKIRAFEQQNNINLNIFLKKEG
jgi:hypothetical protein